MPSRQPSRRSAFDPPAGGSSHRETSEISNLTPQQKVRALKFLASHSPRQGTLYTDYFSRFGGDPPRRDVERPRWLGAEGAWGAEPLAPRQRVRARATRRPPRRPRGRSPRDHAIVVRKAPRRAVGAQQGQTHGFAGAFFHGAGALEVVEVRCREAGAGSVDLDASALELVGEGDRDGVQGR